MRSRCAQARRDLADPAGNETPKDFPRQTRQPHENQSGDARPVVFGKGVFRDASTSGTSRARSWTKTKSGVGVSLCANTDPERDSISTNGRQTCSNTPPAKSLS